MMGPWDWSRSDFLLLLVFFLFFSLPSFLTLSSSRLLLSLFTLYRRWRSTTHVDTYDAYLGTSGSNKKVSHMPHQIAFIGWGRKLPRYLHGPNLLCRGRRTEGYWLVLKQCLIDHLPYLSSSRVARREALLTIICEVFLLPLTCCNPFNSRTPYNHDLREYHSLNLCPNVSSSNSCTRPSIDSHTQIYNSWQGKGGRCPTPGTTMIGK